MRAAVTLAAFAAAALVGACSQGPDFDIEPGVCYFVARPEDVHTDEFGIHVPFFAKKDAAVAAKYLSVLDWTNKGGLWLGANNTRNAVQSVLRLKGAA